MSNNRNIEIMAPAGSFESLAAAINAGAGSVYFGIEQLNMRARSSNNFTIEDLRTIVATCQENGVHSYLTMNTIIYDHDINLMQRILNAAKEAGVTAVIMSDLAGIHYAKSIGITIHLSTQVNVTNIEAVKFYASYADVIVLARELSLKQTKSITEEIKKQHIVGPAGKLIQIEIFVHGALCMAVSGKCYLSLHENNASANRGACQQTCRKGYTVTEKETGYQLDIDNEYIMSPKDLCTINFVDQIIEAGVTVFKIEGRGRAPEYVDTVVKTYKEACEAYFEGSYTAELKKTLEDKLARVYNRGFWDGYYLGRKLGEWSPDYGSVASKRKIYIAKGSNYFSKLGVAEFKVETGSLSVGDEILITGPTTGIVETTIKELRVNLKTVETAQKGDDVSFLIDKVIRRSDKLYKVVDAEQATSTN